MQGESARDNYAPPRSDQWLRSLFRRACTSGVAEYRKVRSLIQEIIVDVDDFAGEVQMVIHWAGGRHSELRTKKNPTGRHNRCTSLEAIEIIRQMAGRFPDEQIGSTLNRLGLKTGSDNRWIEMRVRMTRRPHRLPAYDRESRRITLTLEEAAARLGISHKLVRRLIESEVIAATQVVLCVRWEIPEEAIQTDHVSQEIATLRRGPRLKKVASSMEPSLFADV